MNAEFIETKMNKSLLQQLAAHTGGRYYNSKDIETLANDIQSLPNFRERLITHTAEIDLWNSWWMLGLAILLFTLEWFIRKRSGML